MIKYIYLIVFSCVIISCLKQNSTQDKVISETEDSIISVNQDIATSESISPKVSIDTVYRLGKDTTMVFLSNGLIFKAMVTKDPGEIVKYPLDDISENYTGSKGQIIIYSNLHSDTITITRKELKKYIKLENMAKLDEFDIWTIYFWDLKDDTVSFDISFNQMDTDYGFNFLCHYNYITGKYSIGFNNELPDESEEEQNLKPRGAY